MKVICFTRDDGGLSIVCPAETARLVASVEFADGSRIVNEAPRSLEQTVRRWPIVGAVVEWGEDEEAFARRIAERDVPVTLAEPYVASGGDVLTMMHRGDAERLGLAFSDTSYTLIEATEIPADRTYRNGWKMGEKTVEHDLEACREIHKNLMRAARAPKFAQLDVEWMRATARGDAAAAATAELQRQVLRDVTNDAAIEAAATVEELRTVWPECLGEPVVKAVDQALKVTTS